MDPAILFRIANMIALAGWAALILGVLTGRAWLRVGVAGRAVPIILSVLYTALVAVAWPGAGGGYGTLGAVALLFEDPRMLLAGWAHYLAFDLLVGGSIADEVDRRGLTRWLLLPALPLTFLFGPVGLLVLLAGAALLRPAPRTA
ncbi:abscisic acid-deficient protein Aba4 family protein [Pararoseomonas sp. SCSIO 73927]|uniref:abscisic acid-deficient protein Aba4 family protein n=1 Tax=Pararoseomonas sp. SCSIO 73927 TaxID=3114537 RepID=UPI0030CC9A7A